MLLVLREQDFQVLLVQFRVTLVLLGFLLVRFLVQLDSLREQFLHFHAHARGRRHGHGHDRGCGHDRVRGHDRGHVHGHVHAGDRGRGDQGNDILRFRFLFIKIFFISIDNCSTKKTIFENFGIVLLKLPQNLGPETNPATVCSFPSVLDSTWQQFWSFSLALVMKTNSLQCSSCWHWCWQS